MEHIWQNIVDFVTTWGPNNIVAAIISSLLTLTIVFSRQIGHAIFSMFKWFWATIISGRGKDYAFERAYLNWIINQHRYLGLLPARVVAARWGEEGRSVDLEKVYVSLHVSAQGGDKTSPETSTSDPSSWRKPLWLYAVLRKNLWFSMFFSIPLIILSISIAFIFFFHYSLTTGLAIIIPLVILCLLLVFIKRRVSRGEETYQIGDLALAIDNYKQLVIRGDPGSGKTTLLRYLAVTCARALRNSKKRDDGANIVKKRLLWTTRPFPILITLRRYGNVALSAEKKPFIDVFSEEMPSDLRKRCPQGFFERKLAKGNCLILLDAFDELGSPEARAAMARRIEDFLSIYDHPRNRVVVTTRIVGYEGQLDRYGFQIRTVQHLQAGEIRALVKQRYEAIALSETAGWPPHDAAPIKQEMRRRSEQLIEKIESTPRLAQLATNPLLLSLIVLVHRVKIALPEERVLLYRDCVEILTEQWQRTKRAESYLQPDTQEDLSLPQKLVLLQALALDMQKRREEEDQRTLLPQSQAQKIIADKLPDILGSQLPATEPERGEICRRKAETWVKSIQAESGILVEQGLDEAGDPLIGFSHLTFQEYLAAVAINEMPTGQDLLASHLLQPAWREVALLYVALTNDATSIIEQLLNGSQQPASIVLAGFCLAEKVKQVKDEVQQSALAKLKEGFEHADDSMARIFGSALAAIGGSEVTAFMREQLHNSMLAKRLEAIKALAQTKPADPQIKDVQEDLVELLETPNDVALMVATRETLAQIGDPRFTGKEPVVVAIPQQTGSIPSSPKRWKELLVSPEWLGAKKLRQKFSLLDRVFDYWCFMRFHPLRQKLRHGHIFAMSKYPVTNIEYARFVEATEHRAPKYWLEGTYATEKATHPVTGITAQDAKAYCTWLSRETGATYRLPTEWEWEWAATDPQGQQYPWGKQFDKDKCNTEEAATRETTPVGSYLAGTNPYGQTDMIGNVWEITQGYTPSLSLKALEDKSSFLLLLCYLGVGSVEVAIGVAVGVGVVEVGVLAGVVGVGVGVLVAVVAVVAVALSVGISTGILLGGISGGVVGSITAILTAILTIVLLVLLSKAARNALTSILRGGAFDTPADEATCFFRKEYLGVDKNVGFRCVKEL